jgi:NAD-dependent SIR2 family protein deacetylase
LSRLGKTDLTEDNVSRKKNDIKVVRCLHCGSVMKLQDIIKRGNHDPPLEMEKCKKKVRNLA